MKYWNKENDGKCHKQLYYIWVDCVSTICIVSKVKGLFCIQTKKYCLGQEMYTHYRKTKQWTDQQAEKVMHKLFH